MGHKLTVPILSKECPVPIPDDVQVFMDLMDGIAAQSGASWSFVGGFARDMLLGKQPNDFDVCSQNNYTFQHILSEMKCLDIGEQQNTREKPHDKFYNPYSFEKRPYDIHWIEADEQAAFAPTRFDFTINHFAMKSDGRIYAPDYAWKDLLVDKVLKLSDEAPSHTTNILMRAVRFSVKYGLTIDPNSLDKFKQRIEAIEKHDAQLGDDLLIKHYRKMIADDVQVQCYELLTELGLPTMKHGNSLEELIAYHSKRMITGEAVTDATGGGRDYDE